MSASGSHRRGDPRARSRAVQAHPGAVRDRRRAGRARPPRSERDDLPGRVRAAQPAAAIGWQGTGAASEAATYPRHLQPAARRPPSPAPDLAGRPLRGPTGGNATPGPSSSPSARASVLATGRGPGRPHPRQLLRHKGDQVRRWADENNWLNRIEPQSQSAPLLPPRRDRPPRTTKPRNSRSPTTSTGAMHTATTPNSVTSPDDNSPAKPPEPNTAMLPLTSLARTRLFEADVVVDHVVRHDHR
jgi:hypothetical protein